MNALLIVLRKTVVFQFYRQNAGLFFIGLMLAGSFLRAGDHIALAEAAVHSPFMLGLYQVAWLLYTVFATRFAVKTIRQTDVLYLLRLVAAPRRWLALLTVQFTLLDPVLIYTAFVGWVSWQQHTIGSTGQLVAGYACMLVLPLFWLEYTLRTPNRQPLTASFGNGWHTRFTTPHWLFFIRHLLNNQPVLLFLTKGGTVLLLLGILALYPTGDYDSRLLLLGMLVIGLCHSSIAYHLYQFEHERLALLRNLPLPAPQRLLGHLLIFGLFLVPEGLLLLRYPPENLSFGVILGSWLFGHSVLFLVFTLLLPRHRTIDQLMPPVSGLLLFFFLCVMYKLPGWGLTLLNWSAGSWLFVRFYLKSVWVTDAPA